MARRLWFARTGGDACGAPVIAADTSSLPEVIGLAEALFDPMDVGSIRDKIYQALTDTDFRQRLCEHGLQRTKLFFGMKPLSAQ